MSAHNRNPLLAAPSRPRGGGYAGAAAAPHHATRDYSAPYPSGPRRPSTTMQFTNPTYRSTPPVGPRVPPTGPGPRPDGPFRGSSNSTSTTYPRTQRFGQHLADLPQVVKGGKKTEEPYATAKLQKLEQEMERMRQNIADKERQVQPELREWSKLERESERAAFKSQMAEESLRASSGDEGGGVAF